MLTDALLGLPVWALAALAGFYFLGGMIKGITGAGMPLFLIPLSTQFLDAPAAVALLIVPMVLTNVAQAREGGHTVAAVRGMVPILLPLIAGALVGVHLLISVNRHVLNLILGCSFIGLAFLLGAMPRVRIGPEAARRAGPLVGLAAGLLGGMSAIFGPPMIAYLVGIGVDPDTFVKRMAIMALTASATMLLTLSGAGAMAPADLAISACALVPIVLGMPVGRWLRGRIRPAVFRYAVLLVLAASGVDLMRRALS